MTNIQLEPYLFFKGTCQEAMAFYKGVFGGELTMLKLGDNGMEPVSSPEDKVMHARLEGGDAVLMASDGDAASPRSAKVTLSLTGDDDARLRQIFEALANGGEVQSALKKEVWGDTFGNLYDKHGVEWMMNINASKSS
jgi:PhnB protein